MLSRFAPSRAPAPAAPASAGRRGARPARGARLAVRAFGPGGDLVDGLDEGMKIRVTASIKVQRGRRGWGRAVSDRAGAVPGAPPGPRPGATPWSIGGDATRGPCAVRRRPPTPNRRRTPTPNPTHPLPPPHQVYHVPKTPELDIAGMTGTVTAVVTHHKGVEISATMPYRVLLDVPPPTDGGKAPKVVVHLAGGELEIVA
jgi:hypothetical protein